MTDTSIAEERHRCEVRWCIRQGAAWFKAWAAGDPPRVKSLSQARGEPAARRLVQAVIEQARLGNTGQPGEWKEPQRDR